MQNVNIIGGVGMDLREGIQTLVDIFYREYPEIERVPFDITLTDDLDETSYKLRPDLRERFAAQGKGSDGDSNGRMVPPCNLDEKLHVLINTGSIQKYTEDGSMTWVGTIAHELTHAADFYQMARLEGLDNYDPLQEISRYELFQYWTEYHARKLGYSFLRKFLAVDADDNDKDAAVDYISKVEWPHHMDDHFDTYHECADRHQQIIITMHLLGRYSVWCDLFPETFNEEKLSVDFYHAPWMYHLFSFMRQHETLDAIYWDFPAMRRTLRENWENI